MTTAPVKTRLEPLVLRPMGRTPLVSVLIANYNYQHFIGQTLASVLEQKYGHFEVVICDDGSTDDSIGVIESYLRKDSRIRLIRQPNGGHASALNTAFSACNGEVICLLDSDDLFLSDKIERVVSGFRREPGTGVLVHRVVRVNEARRAQGVWPLYGELPEGWQGERLLQSGGVLPYLPPTSGLSFRREVLERIFPLPTALPVGACPDQVLMRLAPLLSAISRLDDVLSEYRVHGANTYTKRRFTLETVDREITLGERLWESQHDFLSRISPELGSELASVGHSEYFLLLKYIRSKLNGGAGGGPWEAFLSDLNRQANRRKLWFWRSTRYMPRPVFRYVVNLLMSQSALKQWLARFKGLI
jgi:glycosyltransferase involved in cell wall biosynthesis